MLQQIAPWWTSLASYASNVCLTQYTLPKRERYIKWGLNEGYLIAIAIHGVYVQYYAYVGSRYCIDSHILIVEDSLGQCDVRIADL